MRLSQPEAGGGPRRRVLLVAPASSYRIAPYLAAAHRLGIEPVVVSQGEHSLVGAVAGGIQIDFADQAAALDTVLAACAANAPAAVIATDDAGVALAAQIARRLNLPHNPPEAAQIARRKDLARARLTQAGVPVPRFWLLDLARPLAPQLRRRGVPVRGQAVGAFRKSRRDPRRRPGAIAAACARTAAIVAREQPGDRELSQRLLVEEFIPGPEVALEGMLDDGRLQVLTLFDKPDPLDGPYFEETYYVSPSRLAAAVQTAYCHARERSLCRLWSAAWTGACRIALWRDQAWVLEIAARTIGGQCARILRYGAGHSLEELVLSQALGNAIGAHEHGIRGGGADDPDAGPRHPAPR